MGPRQSPLSSLRRKPLHGGSPERQAPMAAGTGRVLPPRPWGHGDTRSWWRGAMAPRCLGLIQQCLVAGRATSQCCSPCLSFPYLQQAGSPSGTPQALGHPSQPRDSCHPQLCCPCPLSITPSAVGKPFGEREGCVCSQSEREIQIAGAFLQIKLSFLRTGLTAEGGTGLLQPQSLA